MPWSKWIIAGIMLMFIASAYLELRTVKKPLTEEEMIQWQVTQFGEELGALRRGDLLIVRSNQRKTQILAFRHFSNGNIHFHHLNIYVNQRFRDSIIQIVRQDNPDYGKFAVQHVRYYSDLPVEIDDEGNLVE